MHKHPTAELLLILSLIQLSNTWTGSLTYITLDGKVCVKCPPGTFWESDCQKEYTVAQCQLCTRGTFSADYNRAIKCQPCGQSCSVSTMEVTSRCSTTSDITCECPTNHYFSHGRGGRSGKGVCIQHTECNVGFGVSVLGNQMSDTVCAPCMRGCSFSDVTSAVLPCQQCTSCGHYKLTRTECDIGRDTTCTESMQTIQLNNTFNVPQEPVTNLSLIITMVIAFSITMFILVLVVFKLCQARNDNKRLRGIEGPFGSSVALSDKTSMRSGSRYTGITLGGYSLSESKASSMTLNLPTASECYTRSSRSVSSVHFPFDDDRSHDWEAQYGRVFNFIARLLASHWKLIILSLMSDACPSTAQKLVDQLDSERRSTRNKLYEGLLEWKHTGGDTAHPAKLLSTLNVLEFYGVAIKLRKRFPAIFNDDDEDDRETDV